MLIDRILAYCREADYVTEEQAPWVRYILEKNITTVCGAIPFLLFAVVLTSWETAFAFLLTFYLIRSRINGFHARTFIGCLVASVVCEYIFLGIIYPYLAVEIKLCILFVATVLILVFAPFQHTNMPLTQDEYLACRRSARARTIIIALLGITLSFANCHLVADGIIMGVAMAAVMLVLAYLQKKGVDVQ